MRTCPRCSTGYPDETEFCPEDGARLAPDAEPSLVGVCLEERYLLEERIGSGGLGQVYRGRHVRMEKAFAVKLLLPTLVADDTIRQRFDREARALSRLTHPCCVGVTDYGICKLHGPYIVMELVDGTPLSHHTRGAGLGLGESVELVTMVLRGLEHAHEQGIAHRDLKPDNIMLLERPLEPGRLLPKILDFGLAKIRAGFGSGAGAELTQAGLLVGTPAYMAPERLAVGRGKGADDTLADIYSVGIILYELCCGRRPFVDEDVVAVIDMQLNLPPPPPRTLRPSLPGSLEAVVLRALDKDPSARFPSAAAFREALEALPALPAALAEERPGPARRATGALTRVERRQPEVVLAPASPSTRTDPAQTRSRRPLLLAAIALLALGLVGGALLLLSREGPAPVRSSAKASRARPGHRHHGGKKSRRSRPMPAPAPETPEADEALPEALRRAGRLWHNPHRRQQAAKQLMGYLARHRGDAAAHLYVGRLYLYAFWSDDGLKLVRKALRIDPDLRLDDATLVALTFAYRGKTQWGARKLVARHAGDRAAVVLLASAAAMRDKAIKHALLRHARALGAERDPLARRLLALARARGCKNRRAALRALEGEQTPPVRIMLALLGSSRCLADEARRMLKAGAPPG